MMVLISFFSSLTKKDSVERARYEIGIKFFSTLTQVLGRFFHRSGFLADPDPKHRFNQCCRAAPTPIWLCGLRVKKILSSCSRTFKPHLRSNRETCEIINLRCLEIRFPVVRLYCQDGVGSFHAAIALHLMILLYSCRSAWTSSRRTSRPPSTTCRSPASTSAPTSTTSAMSASIPTSPSRTGVC